MVVESRSQWVLSLNSSMKALVRNTHHALLPTCSMVLPRGAGRGAIDPQMRLGDGSAVPNILWDTSTSTGGASLPRVIDMDPTDPLGPTPPPFSSWEANPERVECSLLSGACGVARCDIYNQRNVIEVEKEVRNILVPRRGKVWRGEGRAPHIGTTQHRVYR